MLLWVPNPVEFTEMNQGLNSPFLSSEPTISVLLCISRLEERHYEHWAAPDMKQSNLFINSCQIHFLGSCWPWTGKGIGFKYCCWLGTALRWQIHVLNLVESVICRKCGQKGKSYCAQLWSEIECRSSALYGWYHQYQPRIFWVQHCS
jgi:hypothetical protein